MDTKQQAGKDVASNVIETGSNALTTKQKPGGITGKGFRPGQSGNPTGGTRRRREAKALSEQIRDYLAQPDDEATKAAGRKTTRLQALIIRLEQTDAKTLLAYAYGKPVEMVDVNANLTSQPLKQYVLVSPDDL
jgi:hypothetical protein